MTSLLAYAFGGIVRARGALYDRGLLRVDRAERPVISVGNIAAGGTGKTPFTILLANRLHARGERVAVLSRGYGATSPSASAVVVDPKTSRAEEVGDEPILIARKTSAQVVVTKKRIDGARRAIEGGATILLLDDGFQHRRLARDLDIVLLDASDPYRGGLLPHGRLREPPAALARANLIAIIGDPQLAIPDLPERPVLRVEVEARPAIALQGRRVALIAAIGRPERFEHTVRALGANIVSTRYFRDHRRFDPEPAIAEARAKNAELILTTEKDHARQPHPELTPLPIEHRIATGEEHLDRALAEVLGR